MECCACHAAVDPHGIFPGGTVICGACGARNDVPAGNALPRQDHYRAPEPHAPEPPAPQASRELAALCPRCPHALADDAEQGGIACAACGGVFVEHASLARLVGSARPSDGAQHARHAAHVPSTGKTAGYVRCPTCRQPMTPMNFGKRSGIVVDACREHGTWFDRGELGAVLDFVRAGGIEPDVAAHDRESLDPEAQRVVREAEAAMRAEALASQAEAAAVVHAVDDVVWILFGPRYRIGRRW